MQAMTVQNKIKRWASEITDGMLLSGHPIVEHLDLNRDYDDVEKLVILEQWPFIRSDFEVSHAQPGATSMVARKDGLFAGFFTTHSFGEIGYLDMMIMDPRFRGTSVARPLFFKTMHALSRGRNSFVVHTTNDSARIIGLLGFQSTDINFTLMVRPAIVSDSTSGSTFFEIRNLSASDRDEIIRLDSLVFGSSRSEWIDALLKFGNAKFIGLGTEHKLRAVLCLRPRRGGAECLDICAAESYEDLADLLTHTLSYNSKIQLECFARTNSFLHGVLASHGFAVPEFFKEIGPLVEWHKGRNHKAGLNSQCLIWL